MEEKRKAEIKENYLRVRERVENAKAHRNAGEGDVILLGATKTVPQEEILYAVNELGLEAVGENRVQEFLSKYESLKNTVPLHIIGHLQTNKVKSIIGKADMIQSVDSVHLAKEISEKSLAAGCVTDILCEINIGREMNKSGIMPEDFNGILEEIECFPGIRVRGIMTMAPVCEKNDDYKKYFSGTYSIYLDFCSKKMHNIGEIHLIITVHKWYTK